MAQLEPGQRARAATDNAPADQKPATLPPPVVEKDPAVQQIQAGINKAVDELRAAMKEIKGTPITSAWENWGAKLTEPFRSKDVTTPEQLVKTVERAFSEADQKFQGRLKIAEMHGTKDYWAKYKFKPELAKPLSEEEYLRLDGDSRVHYQTHQLMNKVVESLRALKPDDKSLQTKITILRERWELATPAAQLKWMDEVKQHPYKP